MKKIVVIVPHGDDEILGFGGTINKHTINKDLVTVVFVIAAYNERSALQLLHTKQASNLLGYSVCYLNILPQQLVNFNATTLETIENKLKELFPDVLYTVHPGDVHQDHASLFEYVKIATRIKGPVPVPIIYCGEILSSTGCGININLPFLPQHYELLTLQDIRQKQKGLACYAAEIQKYPHPRSKKSILVHAQKRGIEAGGLYAEAFQCVRYINK